MWLNLLNILKFIPGKHYLIIISLVLSLGLTSSLYVCKFKLKLAYQDLKIQHADLQIAYQKALFNEKLTHDRLKKAQEDVNTLSELVDNANKRIDELRRFSKDSKADSEKAVNKQLSDNQIASKRTKESRILTNDEAKKIIKENEIEAIDSIRAINILSDFSKEIIQDESDLK